MNSTKQVETNIKIRADTWFMKDKGEVHICLLPEQAKKLEEYGKSKGLLNLRQTIELILNEKIELIEASPH